MEPNQIKGANFLDILFDGRNKEYGAYELRKTYNRRVVKSMVVMGSVVVLITAFYVGSVVDPLANLHGLPVTVVNQDRGAMIGTQQEQAWPPACCSLAWRRSHARSGDSSRLSYPPLRRPTR